MKKVLVFIAAFAITFIAFGLDYTPVTEEDANVFSGTLTSTGLVVETPTTATIADAGVLTPTASVYLLSGIDGANDTTNTITVANPTAAGQELTIIVGAASSNLLSLQTLGMLLYRVLGWVTTTTLSP